MEEQEITLNDLQSMTGFSKRQIYNWQQAGIVPEPIRRERTGRLEGEIVYYPREAYHRLRSIKILPISSMTRTVGVDSLFFPLFLFGFRDEKIDEGIKRLFKKAIRYIRNELKKEQKAKDLGESIGRSSGGLLPEGIFEDVPVAMIQIIILRLMGKSKREVKQLLPDSSDEMYDSLPGFLKVMEGKIKKKTGCGNYKGDYFEDYIKAFRQLAGNYFSLKEANDIINHLNEKDLTVSQAGMELILALFTFYGLPAELLLELFKKKSFIYGFCILGLINYITIKHFMGRFSTEVMKELLALPENDEKRKKSRKNIG